MKTLRFIGISFILSASALLSSCNNKSKNDYSESEIIRTYAEAVDAFAKSMPGVGGDTESYWAADTIHQIAANVLKGKYNYNESLAKIYYMQHLSAYGMCYFSGIMCKERSMEEADEILGMVSATDSVYQILSKENFSDFRKIQDFGFLSLYHLQMFLHVQNAIQMAENKGPVYDEGSYRSSFYCMKILESLRQQGIYTEADINKFSSQLEGTVFFNTICPMILAFSPSESAFNANKARLMEAANFYDENAAPIYNAIKVSNSIIPPLSDSEYKAFVKKSTQYKAMLLNMAAEEMKAIGIDRKL